MAKRIRKPESSAERFHREILDNRARLIRAEIHVGDETDRFFYELEKRWVREINRIVRRSRGPVGNAQPPGAGVTATEIALARRQAEILLRIGVLTRNEIRRFEKWLGVTIKDTVRRESLRVESLIQGVKPQLTVAAEVDIGISFSGVHRKAVKAAMKFKAIPGANLTTSFANLSDATMKRMKKEIATVIAEGGGIDNLARKIRRLGGPGRHLRREANMLARTSIMSASNEAHIETYRQNSDLIRGVQWEATFDSRTCQRCGALHGKKWPVGQAPPIPAHPNCRCVLLPVFINPDLRAGLESLAAYTTPKGTVRYRQADRRFDTWLRKRPAGDQRDFFQSELKFRSFRDRKLRLDEMLKADGAVMSDYQIARRLGDRQWLLKNIPSYRDDLRRWVRRNIP